MKLSSFVFVPLALLLVSMTWMASAKAPAPPRFIGRIARSEAASAAHSKHIPAVASPPSATPLYSFTGGADGGTVYAPLVQGSDGNFYGTTDAGGVNNFGTVFQMKPDGTLRTLASFSTTGGYYSYTALVEGLNPDGSPDGTFFGTTLSGGTSSGTVFKVAPDAKSPTGYTLSFIYSFVAGDGPPTGSLVPGRNSDGTFDGFYYGTTYQSNNATGSTTDLGTVFKITAGGAETVIHRFSPLNPGSDLRNQAINDDGFDAAGGVVQARNAAGSYEDAFLGANYRGGPNGSGTVYQVTREGVRTVLYAFTSTDVNKNSAAAGYPFGPLTAAKDGSFYGVTGTGGTLGGGSYNGVVYRLVPQSSSATGYAYSEILDLMQGEALAGSEGSVANAELTQASDGSLYGITHSGSLIKIVPDALSTTGFSAQESSPFPDSSQEYHVTAPVIQATDGDLYGTTNDDGPMGFGTIFRLNLGLPVQAAPPPTISSLSYYVLSSSSREILIQGSHFVNGATVTVDGVAAASVKFGSAQGLIGYLSQKLPGGSHTVIVTNPDGQSVSATLKIIVSPTITPGGATSYTVKNGTVYLVVSGDNFGTPGYNGSADGLQVDVHDSSGGIVPATLVVRAAASTFGGPQQVVATVDTSFAVPGKLTVAIVNGDGQSSLAAAFEAYSKDQTQYAVSVDSSLLLQAYQLYVQGRGAPAARPTDTSASSSDNTSSPAGAARQAQGRSLRPNVLGNPTQITGNVSYQVNPDGTATITANGTNFVPGGIVVVTNASAGTRGKVTLRGDSHSQVGNQIVDILSQPLPPGNHDVTHINPDGQSAKATFSVAASSPTQVLLGQVAVSPLVLSSTAIIASGIGTSATGLISVDASSLVSNSSGTLVSNSSGTLVSNSSGTLVSNSSGTLVSNSSGTLVSNSSGTLVNGLAAAVASDTGLTGSLGLTPQFGPAPQARRQRTLTAHAAPTTPLTFTLTKHDAGTARGTGQSDLKVSLNYADGTSAYLLDLHFTPGQPDVVAYQAPGVTLTPKLGAPAPPVTSPVPSLTALSPNTANPGTPGLTLTATGTFFTTGTVLQWNGQPLHTTIVSGTKATAVVPAALLATSGTAMVTTVNPAPGGGTSASLPFTIIALTHLFQPGLQMFSVPADYSALPLSQVLNATSPHLAVWTPVLADYVLTPNSPADALRPGQGYWAKFAAATGLIGAGVPTRIDQPFSIALSPGWNMIGDPFPSATALSSIQVQAAGVPQGTFSQAVSDGLVSGTLYIYGAGDTQYQSVGQTGSLAPYAGAWVYAYRPCTLQVPAPSGLK